MIYQPGTRVEWAHNEPEATFEETHGQVVELCDNEKTCIVRWDDGSVETEFQSDLVRER
jgi:hypothetical protein